jgi:hypothetical protein
MKQFTIDGYEIREADGGGMSDRILYFVSTEAVAKAIVGKSHYLSYRAHKETFTVFDTIEEIETASKEALRARALAKLSAAEKAALGL